MTYSIAPLFCRPWTLNGMAPRLIDSHYEHNYGAAVRRLNAVTAELAELVTPPSPKRAVITQQEVMPGARSDRDGPDWCVQGNDKHCGANDDGSIQHECVQAL